MIPTQSIFGMGAALKRNSKRRGKLRNQEAQGAQNMFFHQAVLAVALCGQTISQCPEDAREGRTPFPTPGLIFHLSVSVSPGAQFKVNSMQCWAWWGSLDFLILPMPLFFSANTIDMEFFNKKRNLKHLL